MSEIRKINAPKMVHYREIFRLAVPNILANITIPLLSLADLTFMGRLDSTSYIGAIAIGGVVFNILYWSLGFLRTGTAGLTAQAFGAKNNSKVDLLLFRGVALAIVLAGIVFALKSVIADPLFDYMGGEEEVSTFAKEYFHTRIWAVPAALINFVFVGWYIGNQNTKVPLLVSIAVNVVNIGVSAYLVINHDLRHQGVAWGTVVAQYAGMIIYGLITWLRHVRFRRSVSLQGIARLAEWKQFFRIGGGLFIRSLVLILVFTYFTKSSAEKGDDILAINTIFREFLLFLSFFMDGLAHAAEAIVGKYYGRKEPKMLRQSVSRIFNVSRAIVIVFTLIYVLLGEHIVSLLTSGKADITSLFTHYELWFIAIPAFSYAAFIWDGVFVGMAKAKDMLVSASISAVVFFILEAFLPNVMDSNSSLLLAMLCFMLVRGGVLRARWYAYTQRTN